MKKRILILLGITALASLALLAGLAGTARADVVASPPSAINHPVFLGSSPFVPADSSALDPAADPSTDYTVVDCSDGTTWYVAPGDDPSLVCSSDSGTGTTDPGSTDPGSTDSVMYVQCSDGTVWSVDTTYMSADDFGVATCPDGYTVYASDPSLPPPDQGSGSGSGNGDGSTNIGTVGGGGVALSGLDNDPNAAPDPSLYGGQVECPDGSIWNIPIGQDFVCPAP